MHLCPSGEGFVRRLPSPIGAPQANSNSKHSGIGAGRVAPRIGRLVVTSATPRQLSGAHFAFMRALVQGLDQRESWDRYLRLEGEHTDLRVVHRTVTWIRDAFAAAAKRESKHGTARLILLDPARLNVQDKKAVAPAFPSLAEFAEANGMEDFAEEEQISAYTEAYPSSGGKGAATAKEGIQLSRRARLISRQLEALRWLEGLVARNPRPGDDVGAWLHPVMAARLERAGLKTLNAVVDRINGVGARWWLHVPGVGARKADRILDWLRANETVLGLRIGAHVAVPRQKLPWNVLDTVLPPATALRPLERFVVPPALDGRHGRFRRSSADGSDTVATDLEAVQRWLSAKAPAAEGAALSTTQRAYRKEVERLLLWSVLERKLPLSSLSRADATDYLDFLAAPPPNWCGPRHHQRWSPLWRPMEGPISAAGQAQAVTILRSLFAFWMTHGHVTANPFARLDLPLRPADTSPPIPTQLTMAQWKHLDASLAARVESPVGRRLHRAVRWFYMTGVRLSELTNARCGHLQCAGTPWEPARLSWHLRVADRTGNARLVPIPHTLIEELGLELGRQGFAPAVDAEANRDIALLAQFDSRGQPPRPWTASGLHKALKTQLSAAAATLSGDDAQHMARASARWLRHSHGAHALAPGEGRLPVPLEVVRNNMGHVSAATTARYLGTPAPGVAALSAFWVDAER